MSHQLFFDWQEPFRDCDESLDQMALVMLRCAMLRRVILTGSGTGLVILIARLPTRKEARKA